MIGYDGDYLPIVAKHYDPKPIGWVKKNTPASDLGFS
jgi:hypothetical protein